MRLKLKGLLLNPYLWAIAIRVALFLHWPRQLRGDAGDFELIASNLALGHGFSRCTHAPFPVTSVRPPLYPLLLGLLYLQGASHMYGAFALNLVTDLLSMRFARLWARELRLSWSRHVPWVVGLCPLLITHGVYPTTENLSVLLFLCATFLLFRRLYLASGIAWGLLALCRSYYLAFPWLLLAIRPHPKWARKGLTILAFASLIAPAPWVLKNYSEQGGLRFSQGSTTGWQAYQGVMVQNFDWWNPVHYNLAVRHPVLSKMMASHCLKDSEIEDLDQRLKNEIWEFVEDKPWEAARNVLAKGFMLFVNWGQFMPYDPIEETLHLGINGLMVGYWIFVAYLILTRKRAARADAELDPAIRFAACNIAYVALVTIPFAVDARYLLNGFLTLLICVIELVRRRYFARAG